MEFIRDQVDHESGIGHSLVGFPPESATALTRNGDRNQPGTLIAFTPES
jgi:hypothetical protein